MNIRRRVMVAIAAVMFAALVGIVIFSQVQEAQAGPCRCPKILAPVVCDNGRTFANPCLAECHNAKNCVPDPNGL